MPEDTANKITVGELQKYANLAKGYRPRLFVLHSGTGILSYYKGLSSADIGALMEKLKREGEVVPVGAAIGFLQKEAIKRIRQGGMTSPLHSPNVAPAFDVKEIHLQVAKFRKSSVESRKFHVDNGTSDVVLKAETPEDRQVWLDALRAVKAIWTEPGSSTVKSTEEKVTSVDNAFLGRLAEVRLQLQDRGATQRVQDYVEDLLLHQHQATAAILRKDIKDRHDLICSIRKLENEKRELETAIAVEPTGASKAHLLGKNSGVSASQSSTHDDDSDEDKELDEGASEPHQGSSDTDASDEEAEFHDASELERALSTDLPPGLGRPKSDAQRLSSLVPGALKAQHGEHGQPSLQPTNVVASSAAGPPPPATSAFQPPATSSPQPAVSTTVTTVPAQQPGPQSDRGSDVQHAAPPGAPPEDPPWLKAAGPPPKRRTHLPKPAQSEKAVSLWAIIKDVVGKDLQRVCLPVYFNEPLSALQKTVEDLEYTELLDQAAELSPGMERMLLVAAFAVSGYSSTGQRTSKPFNPLLGETYEMVCPEKGLRALAEKVVHHPTVIAAVAEGRRWRLQGDVTVKSKFWGRSIELQPLGILQLTFHDGDVCTWQKVTTSINNLIIGRLNISHGGVMRVRSTASGLTAKLRFKEQGMLSKGRGHEVKGYFEGPNGERHERPTISGRWDEELDAEMPDGSTRPLWRMNPPAPDPTRYNLTQWAIQLNELNPGLKEVLAPTDCRLRPDQHALELGEYDQANAEKLRLETKQRAARKLGEGGRGLQPRWFTPLEGIAVGQDLLFHYKGGYWECREKGEWPGVRDIFGPNTPEEIRAAADK